MKASNTVDFDQKDKELIDLFKIVENIYFEYSTDEDFEVKVYVLKLIVFHQKRHNNH